MVVQFIDHTGIRLPDEVMATMQSNELADRCIRADYIWANLREEWLAFYEWRWERFFQKVCAAVHAVGKKVWVLGMYCTDPFETRYIYGFNSKRVMDAGVDCMTANILPTSVAMNFPDREYYFHRYHMDLPFLRAQVGEDHGIVTMVGVQDASEEWSVLDHQPVKLERDIYTMTAFQSPVKAGGLKPATDGLFLCLGDGIPRQDWDWERERLRLALSADAESVVSPAMLWSEKAFDKMLPAYWHTRRWTPHKLYYELAQAGVHCAASVRTDGLCNYSGTLVVPNFDLLAPEEQAMVAAYDRGAVFCTACPDFDPKAYGITPAIVLKDGFSDYPMTAFAFGCDVSAELQTQLSALLAEDDGTENLPAPVEHIKENKKNVLTHTLTYAKVTRGFLQAMALLLETVQDSPFRADKESLVLRLKSGAYRMYLLNDHHNKYHRANVTARIPLKDVKIITKFPILPPKFVDSFDSMEANTHVFSDKIKAVKQNFIVKIPPAGIVVVDIWPQ